MLTLLSPRDLRLGKTVIGVPVIKMTEDGSTITVQLAEDLVQPEIDALLAHCVMATPTGYTTDVVVKDGEIAFVLVVEYGKHTRSPKERRNVSDDDETHARLSIAKDSLVERLGC